MMRVERLLTEIHGLARTRVSTTYRLGASRPRVFSRVQTLQQLDNISPYNSMYTGPTRHQPPHKLHADQVFDAYLYVPLQTLCAFDIQGHLGTLFLMAASLFPVLRSREGRPKSKSRGSHVFYHRLLTFTPLRAAELNDRFLSSSEAQASIYSDTRYLGWITEPAYHAPTLPTWQSKLWISSSNMPSRAPNASP